MNDRHRHGSDVDAERHESGANRAQPDTPPRNAPRADPEAGEAGGPSGLEPTRYGDWERNGRCIDF